MPGELKRLCVGAMPTALPLTGHSDRGDREAGENRVGCDCTHPAFHSSRKCRLHGGFVGSFAVSQRWADGFSLGGLRFAYLGIGGLQPL
jgi:hypothetical protein